MYIKGSKGGESKKLDVSQEKCLEWRFRGILQKWRRRRRKKSNEEAHWLRQERLKTQNCSYNTVCCHFGTYFLFLYFLELMLCCLFSPSSFIPDFLAFLVAKVAFLSFYCNRHFKGSVTLSQQYPQITRFRLFFPLDALDERKGAEWLLIEMEPIED